MSNPLCKTHNARYIHVMIREYFKGSIWAKRLKTALRLLLWLIILLILLLGISASLLYYFREDIKKYAIESINEQLQTELKVQKLELSVFKSFPYASLEFTDVACMEVHSRSPKQALFEAKHIYLQFSLWDVFNQNYTVKKLRLENAYVQLFRDKEGNDNWHFWKISKDSSSAKKSFSFKLNSVQFKQVDIAYIDLYAGVEVETEFDRLSLSGRFSEKQFRLQARTDFLAKRVEVRGVEYAKQYKLKLDADFDAHTEKNEYSILKCDLKIEDLPLDAEGVIRKEEKGWYLDLGLRGKKLNIGSILSMLPENIRNIKEQYESTGEIEVAIRTKGHIHKGNFPAFEIDFSVQNATFRYIPESVEMQKVNGKGHLRIASKSDSYIKLDYIEASQKASYMKGSFSWYDFERPRIATRMELSAELAEFLPFFALDTIESVSGRADLKLNLELKASGKRFTAEDFRQASIEGEMQLKDVNAQINASPLRFRQISGNFVFDNNNVWLKQAQGNFAGNDIELDGKALNVLSYFLTTTEPLYLAVNLRSNALNVDELLQQNQTAQKEKSDRASRSFALPERLSVDFNAQIKQVRFGRFEAHNVEGNLSLKDRVLVAKTLLMSSMGGEALISGVADNSKNGGWQITSNGRFSGIRARDLFYSFADFDQDQLTHENVSGEVDADFDFRASFDAGLKVDQKSIYSLINLTIHKGELKNFKPLEKLAGWAKLEELQHVKFSTLTNQILIKDEKVRMPEMRILSNAMNLNVSGEHGFDNVVDYRFNMDLGTLLANKFRLKRSKKQEEFGEIIEDGSGKMRIYVHMYGPMQDLKFGLDGKGVREKLNQDIQNEKVEVRDIINAEFGRVKNDSILKKDPWLKEKQERRDSVRKAARGGSEEFTFE